MTYLLFDIGGTKLRVARSEDLVTIDVIEKTVTPHKPKDAITEIVALTKHMGVTDVTAIAGGLRGILNETKTGIVHDAVLHQWVDFDFAAALQVAFGAVPVYLENDTALAGLGESHFGAGQGIDIMVYHTISTGVGGVKISYGAIDESSMGFEPGHQILDIDRTVLGPDINPTLENLVSGAALESRMGVKPIEIPQSDVIWAELASYLAQGMRNTVLYWSPEIIVLGGAMMVGNPRIPLDVVRKATVATLDNFVPCPFITIAALGDEAGLYGAMARITAASEK
jgi:predicted NBD/HSP70 family sugar kinase